MLAEIVPFKRDVYTTVLAAFGATYRQLQKRLAKKGFTDKGELFITCIAPLQIDEDDDPER